MQRQTGNRVRPLPIPGTPPTAPDTAQDKAYNDKSIERPRAGKVEQHTQE
jgi:hypothetical protein